MMSFQSHRPALGPEYTALCMCYLLNPCIFRLFFPKIKP